MVYQLSILQKVLIQRMSNLNIFLCGSQMLQSILWKIITTRFVITKQKFCNRHLVMKWRKRVNFMELCIGRGFCVYSQEFKQNNSELECCFPGCTKTQISYNCLRVIKLCTFHDDLLNILLQSGTFSHRMEEFQQFCQGAC